jgi:hypothetical protein
MALRTRHAATGVIVTAALIAIAMLPPPPDPRWARFREREPRQRPDQLEFAVRRVARRVDALERRDALRARLQRAPAPPGAGPVLSLDARLPLELAAALRAGWDTAAARLGSLHPGSALVVTVGLDTVDYGWGRAWYFLPPATDGRTCAVTVLIGRSPRGFDAAAPARELLTLLGPCAYHARFGPPGPGIEGWLATRAVRTGFVPQWLEQAPRDRRPLVDAAMLDAEAAEPRTEALVARLFAIEARGELDETACAVGRLAVCRRVLEAPEPALGRRPTDDLPWQGIVYRPFLFSPWPRTEVDYFLSDLVRDEGPDRFARFWRSGAPLDSAFAAAYGRSLEQHARQWLRAWRDVRAGPYIRASSVLVSLVFALAVAGFAAVWTVRRRVS